MASGSDASLPLANIIRDNESKSRHQKGMHDLIDCQLLYWRTHKTPQNKILLRPTDL